jgi:hypothetical protein
LRVDGVPRAAGELAFVERVVAARLALASQSVVVVEALGVEAAVDFVPGGTAGLFGTEGAEFAAISSVSDASFLGVEAAWADFAGAGASAPDATEGDVADGSRGEVADGGLALVVGDIDGAVGSGGAEDLALRSGDVGHVLALGDATDVVLPVALRSGGAAVFVLEEFAASCAVLAGVRSTGEDLAHVAVGGDIAVLLDVDGAGCLLFAASLARESVGVDDAVRVGSTEGGGFEEAASVEAAHSGNPVAERLTSNVLVARIVRASKSGGGLADFFRAESVAWIPAAAGVVAASGLVDAVAECAVTSADLRSCAVVEVATLDGVTRGTAEFASAARAASLVPRSPQAFVVAHAFHLTGVANVAASEALRFGGVPFAIFRAGGAVEFVVLLALLFARLLTVASESVVPEALGVSAAERGGGILVAARGNAESLSVIPDAETSVGAGGLSVGLARFSATVLSLASTSSGDGDFAGSVGGAAVVRGNTSGDGSEDALVLVLALNLAGVLLKDADVGVLSASSGVGELGAATDALVSGLVEGAVGIRLAFTLVGVVLGQASVTAVSVEGPFAAARVFASGAGVDERASLLALLSVDEPSAGGEGEAVCLIGGSVGAEVHHASLVDVRPFAIVVAGAGELIGPCALAARALQGGHVPEAVIVVQARCFVGGQAAARAARRGAVSPLALGIGVARTVGTIADEAGVLASAVLPFALLVGSADSVGHVLALEAAGGELADPCAELSSVALLGVGEDVAASVAEEAVLVPLAQAVGSTRSGVLVLDLASACALSVGGEAGLVAWASVKREGRAASLALHELGVPLASGRRAGFLRLTSASNCARASGGASADGGKAEAVASSSCNTRAVVVAASSPLAAGSVGAGSAVSDERAVVRADAVGPHAVSVGEAAAGIDGFRALLFAAESG